MGVIRTCNECGHRQMLSYNRVDGRVMWWTTCEACGKGNFMARPDPHVIDSMIRAYRKANDDT